MSLSSGFIRDVVDWLGYWHKQLHAPRELGLFVNSETVVLKSTLETVSYPQIGYFYRKLSSWIITNTVLYIAQPGQTCQRPHGMVRSRVNVSTHAKQGTAQIEQQRHKLIQ